MHMMRFVPTRCDFPNHPEALQYGWPARGQGEGVPIMTAKKMYCASWTSRLMGDLHQLSRNRCPRILT